MASKGPECSICFEGYNDKDKCPRMLSYSHLIFIALDCKTVRTYFCVFKYVRAVKQKVWIEAENGERDRLAGESSLRASSPTWASEASRARTRERAAKPRGA